MKKISVLIVLLTGIFANLAAQTGRGNIHGQITTTDDKPAAMVTVTIKSIKKSTVTEEDGSFVFNNILPGNYDIEISLVGYETLTSAVTVEANKTIEVVKQLQISDMQLQEVIVRSGVRNYKVNNPSPSLRLQGSLLEIPQNIQVVTNKVLTDQQIISMSDGLVRNVSGTVRLEHWGDLYTNVNSRGSQVQAFRNGFNVVTSFWGPLTEDMSFVDHIDFVKGPAGFMLSNGDPSGLYNVVTKKPTGQTKGEVAVTVGSYDLYRTTLDLDGKLSKDGRLLYRFNLMGQNKGSFRPNEYSNRYSIAPVLSYQLDNKTKLTLEYTLQHAKMSDVGSYYVFSPKGMGVLPYNAANTPAGLDPTVIDDHSAYINLQHQLSSNWKLTAQGAYFDYTQTGSSMWPAAVNANGTIQRAVSSWDAKSTMTMLQAFINGEVATGAVRHRILGGLDIGTKNYLADWGQYHVLDSVGAEFDPLKPNYGTPSLGYPSFNHTTSLKQRATAVGGIITQRYTGAYLQDELGFLDNKLRLTLAARFTSVEQSAWGGSPYSATKFTPRLGLSASINKQTSIYALYDQAFTPQSGRLSNGGAVQPITGNNIEFGIKKNWGSKGWNTTLAVYRILKNHELTPDPNSPPTAGLSIELGQKRSQGIEFDVRGKIVDGLNIIANYALTDSKVTKVADNVTTVKVGDFVPSYSKHVANTWLTYTIQKGALSGLGFSGGFSYVAGRHTYWDASPDATQLPPDYFKLDGGISWEKDKIRVAVNVFNILDKYIYSASYYSYLNAYYTQVETPRTARLSINYSF